MSRGDFCALVIILLLAGFMAGSIYMALFYKPSLAQKLERSTVTATVSHPITKTTTYLFYKIDQRIKTVTKTIVTSETRTGEKLQGPEVAAGICVIIDGNITVIYGDPANPIELIGAWGGRQSMRIGKVSVVGQHWGSVDTSSVNKTLIYVEVNISGDWIRYEGLSLVDVGDLQLPTPTRVNVTAEEYFCGDFWRDWRRLPRYPLLAAGGSLASALTGITHTTGAGLAIFEIPENKTLDQLALEVRVWGGRSLAIIPLANHSKS